MPVWIAVILVYMVAAGHTSVGVLVAITVHSAIPQTPLWQQAIVVFTLAVLSHYVVDFIPHGHYSMSFTSPTWPQRLMVLLDLVGFALIIGLITLSQYGFGPESFLVAVGIFGAQLTDIWDWVIVERGWIKLEGLVLRHRELHQLIHWHDIRDERGKRRARPIGWWDIWQVFAVSLALALLLLGV